MVEIDITVDGSFKNTMDWVRKMAKKPVEDTVLNQIGKESVKNLSINTPQRTGETARSWKYSIESNGKTIEVNIYNTAHPKSRVSVAKLIDLGYVTRTGGYVPARPYIKRSMRPVWRSVDRLLGEGFK